MKLPSYMRLSWQNQSMQGQANICTSFGNIIAKTNTISKRRGEREREFELLCLRKFCMWKLYGSPQCVCVMRAKLIFTNWLHALVCLIKCLRIQFKFSVLFSFFFLLCFFFSRFFLLFTLARIPLILIIMFALWHTANCVLMCFLLPHHSIRVPNLMLILNLKSTLKLEKL